MNPKQSDVIIIGGGVIGSATTYFLAKRGMDVTLIERNEDFASEASGAAHGFLYIAVPGALPRTSVSGGIPKNLMGYILQDILAVKSFRLFKKLKDELGYDIKYQKKPSLSVVETEEQLETLKKRGLMREVEYGEFSLKRISSEEARELEPNLSEDIVGALYCEEAAWACPMHVNFGFVEAAKREGAKIRLCEEVQSIKMYDNVVESVTTNKGKIKTNFVVDAAGAQAGEIAEMIGVKTNLVPTRIEMLTTEVAPKNLVNGLISCGCFASVWRGFEPPWKPYRYSLISQPPQGNILLGEVVSYVKNKTSTIEGIKTIVTHAIRIMPRLRDLTVIRSWGGLLACLPDYLPIIGKPYDLENFVMACGWVGSGIGFSAITGKLVSEIIIDGEPSTSIDPLGYPRP